MTTQDKESQPFLFKYHWLWAALYYGSAGVILSLNQGWFLGYTLDLITSFWFDDKISRSFEVSNLTNRVLGLPITVLGIYYVQNRKSSTFLLSTSVVRFTFAFILFSEFVFGTLPSAALVFGILDALTGFISWVAVSQDPSNVEHNLMGFRTFWKWLENQNLGSYHNGDINSSPVILLSIAPQAVIWGSILTQHIRWSHLNMSLTLFALSTNLFLNLVIWKLDRVLIGALASIIHNLSEFLSAGCIIFALSSNPNLPTSFYVLCGSILLLELAFLFHFSTPKLKQVWSFFSSLLMHYITIFMVIWATIMLSTRENLASSICLILIWCVHLFYEIYNVSGEFLGFERHQSMASFSYGAQVLVTMFFVCTNQSL